MVLQAVVAVLQAVVAVLVVLHPRCLSRSVHWHAMLKCRNSSR